MSRRTTEFKRQSWPHRMAMPPDTFFKKRRTCCISWQRIRTACWAVLALSILTCKQVPLYAADLLNLALHKPACSSSIENDEHTAAQANDGDPESCWRADDEPEGEPDWWQVDLEKPVDLSGCQIRWPFEGKRYQYKVEGSTDGKAWSLLSDQRNTVAQSAVHDLRFHHARQVRYLKITVTGVDEGCCVSICEVRVFGFQHPKRAPK